MTRDERLAGRLAMARLHLSLLGGGPADAARRRDLEARITETERELAEHRADRVSESLS